MEGSRPWEAWKPESVNPGSMEDFERDIISFRDTSWFEVVALR